MKLFHVYVLDDHVYIPRMSRTESGVFLEKDPIDVVSTKDPNSVTAAIIGIVESEVPTVPTPERDGWPKPVIHKYAKLRSYAAFEREATLWSIVLRDDGVYRLAGKRRASPRGWEDDPAKILQFSGQSAIENLASALLEEIRKITG